ncbi:MarR family winged helix-turn-helix transcriptional regulator [Deinococcus sp.]|uniref:MarR family winged helix-turn-helix transcriptional regulator n=1 Tax=Deinococcus sp. TaxID=47478 RepID=UPI003CC6B5C8
MEASHSSGNLISDLSRAIFYTNRLLLEVGNWMTAPIGLNAADWQLLGIVEHGPEPVSNLARIWSLTRQGVQQTADALARKGLVEYRHNPHHRRAKLVCITPEGLRAMVHIRVNHAAWAELVTAEVSPAALQETLVTLQALARSVAAHKPPTAKQETS